jgi:hypothetical protein
MGILTVANERSGRGGEADRGVSVLKRSGDCFQFLLFRLKSLEKWHSKIFYTKLMEIETNISIVGSFL